MKNFLTIIIFSLFVLNSYGQFSEVDVAIDPNYSLYKIMGGESSARSAGGVGINVRFPMKYNIGENVSIDSRPGFSGYRPVVEETRASRVKSKVHYISAPLYFSYCYQESFSVYLGGEFEYLINSEASGESILSLINQKAVYGVSGGFSYNFRGGLKFNVFYTYGLSSLAKDVKMLDNNGFETDDYLNIKKRYLTIGLSYKLYRRKKEAAFY